MLNHSVVSDSLQPHGLQPARLLCPRDSPGKNTWMGCHFHLQGIFPTQGSNPGLPHCRLYPALPSEPPGKHNLRCSVRLSHSVVPYSLWSLDCSTPDLPVHHQLAELTQTTKTHVHPVSDAIQPSHPLSSLFPPPSVFPASGSFPMSQFFPLGGHTVGVSASSSVLPMNIQDWFP